MKYVTCAAIAFVLLDMTGCGGPSQTDCEIHVGAAGPAMPKRDKAGAVKGRIKMGKEGDTTWAGRKLKVTIQTDPDIILDPPETEVTLDQQAKAEFEIKFTAKKTATKPGYPSTVTITGQDKFSSKPLPVELEVFHGE